MIDPELDTMLSAPLAPVEDAGFSTKVAARVAFRQSLRSNIEWAVIAFVGGILLYFMPMDLVTDKIQSLAFDLGNSAPLAVGLGMLILCIYAVRLVEAE